MKLFDLHCDTITECRNKNERLFENGLHISLNRAACFDSWAQLFAIWIPDELRGSEAKKYFNDNYGFLQNELSENGSAVSFCRTGADIEKALNENKCAAILSVENGSVLCGDAGRVEELSRLGVRAITLTWNGENELAFGSGTGSQIGLKPAGRQALLRMAEHSIFADVSHLNVAGFFDVANAGVPFFVSHSNSRSVHEFSVFPERGLTDEQIKILIECNSVMGINFCADFLGEKGNNPLESIYRHIYHVLEMGGENILCLGSDYDGCSIGNEICPIENLPNLHEFLQKKSFSEDLIEKIFFENAKKWFCA